MTTDVLSLFTIPNLATPDRAALSMALVPIKTRDVIRASGESHPSILRPENPDNLAIVGPDSDYDHYV